MSKWPYIKENILGRPVCSTLSIFIEIHLQLLCFRLSDMVVRSKNIVAVLAVNKGIALAITAQNLPAVLFLPHQRHLQGITAVAIHTQ